MYATSSPGEVLTVVSPIDARWMAAVVVLCVFLFLISFNYGRKVQAVMLLGAIAFAGLVTSHATVVLDGTRNTVSVHTVMFFYPQTRHYPLSSLSGATVSTSDESNAVNLVLAGGTGLQLTPFNQMSGKDEAVFAINDFLRRHGGTGSPY